MNDLEYKHNVLDTLSDSFCAAKWYNATIWLGSGMSTSCHHPPAHLVDKDKVTTNPRLLHNTPQKKADRALMLKGARPSGCEYCWKIEDMGTNAVSDRVYKSKIYPIKALNDAYNTPATDDVALRTLEIAFDRTCQFACSYCNPAFSSTWVKDIKRNGPYLKLESDGRNHFTHEHQSSQLFKHGETNPYVEAFFAWWESELHSSLQELRITGGEPLMSADTWKLIDWFKTNAGKSTTRLAINSNLGTDVDIDRLLASTQDIEIDLYTSCEAVGPQAEYIRDGLVWADWVRNVERLLESGQFRGIHIMCTINALCLTTLPELLDCILNWKRKFGRVAASFTLNVLRFPSFQSPIVLGRSFALGTPGDLRSWYLENKDSELLHEHEVHHVERLLDYLATVDSPHEGAADLAVLQRDFKQFYTQYDVRRRKNFTETFPELADWYRTL